MTEMTKFTDFDTLSLEELETLTIDDLLGEDLAEVSLSSNLPDGAYVFTIEDYKFTAKVADPTNNKKASRSCNVTLNVAQVLQLADVSIDPATLVGRKHFERFNLLSEFGRAGLVKLMLGIVGVKFSDKAAIREIGQSPAALLETLKSEKIAFGGTVANIERNGFENCNLVLREKAFIDAQHVQELLG